MKSLPQHSMTVDEFLAWGAAQEGRYELQDGVVIAMTPERVVHARTKAANLSCEVIPDGVTVRISERTAFEPDASVYCGQILPPDALEVPNPVIVVEVLSPRTSARDVSYKLRTYFTLPSVHHYLIINADDRMVIHHARGEGGKLITRIATEGLLKLDPPGIEVPVTAIFE